MFKRTKRRKSVLSELTRKQYDLLMSDISDYGIAGPFEIRKLRNSKTFKKIFGNKQRIWMLPFNAVSDDVAASISGDHIDGISAAMYNQIIDDMNTIFDVYSSVFNKPGAKTKIENMSPNAIVFAYIKGYVILGVMNLVRIGSSIQKTIDKSRKTNPNDTATIDKLNTILKRFNSRDTTIPEKIYNYAKNLPDNALYGDIKKNSEKEYVCISRYPADVAAMSTGQGWTSCQDLDSDKTKTDITYDKLNWHVKYDIPLGTCVAYLITENNIEKSKNSQNVPTEYDERFKGVENIPKTSLFPLISPRARIAIKPYYGIDENNKNEIFLSVGTEPVVYGNSTSADVLYTTVDKFLTEKQKDISGNFVIPGELYNEAIDGNVVEVKNGIIVNTTQMNIRQAIERDPSSLKDDSVVYQLLDNILKRYNESKSATQLVFADINNRTFTANNIPVSIVYSRLKHCIFNDIKSKIYVTYIIPKNMPNIISSALYGMNGEELSEYGYGGNVEKLQRLAKNEINKYIDRLISTANREMVSFVDCKFNNCTDIDLNDAITLNGCSFAGSIMQVRANVLSITSCDFYRSAISISATPISDSEFDGCSIIINYRIGEHVIFKNCEFKNTKVVNPFETEVEFVDCVIDGKKFQGNHNGAESDIAALFN